MRWWCLTPLLALVAAEADSTTSLGYYKHLSLRSMNHMAREYSDQFITLF